LSLDRREHRAGLGKLHYVVEETFGLLRQFRRLAILGQRVDGAVGASVASRSSVASGTAVSPAAAARA
jgi:hypothetical protein